jgi:hypothetical protein
MMAMRSTQSERETCAANYGGLTIQLEASRLPSDRSHGIYVLGNDNELWAETVPAGRGTPFAKERLRIFMTTCFVQVEPSVVGRRRSSQNDLDRHSVEQKLALCPSPFARALGKRLFAPESS